MGVELWKRFEIYVPLIEDPLTIALTSDAFQT